MRILIVSSGIPTKEYPLLGIFEFDQAKALVEAGHEVTFIAIDLRSVRRWRKWGMSKGSKYGVNYCIVNFPMGRVPLKWLLTIGSKLLFKAYTNFFDKGSVPEIIHAHFTEMGFLACRLHEKTGIPYVVTEHSSKINKEKVGVDLKEAASKAYKKASAVIAVGSSLGSRIKYHTGIQPIVIPNIIDTSIFSQCQKLPHQGFQLVTTSNLIVLKRPWQIIQAMARLEPDVINNTYLTIIGDGPERETIQYWVDKLGLSDHVILKGYQSRESIAKIYETMDCFIMVSSSETFGVAYVEAMAAGLPVIATRCGGPEDFVNEENGLLVDVDNILQFTEAIESMYNYVGNYSVSILRSYVDSNFSPSIIATRLSNLYSDITDKLSN